MRLIDVDEMQSTENLKSLSNTVTDSRNQTLKPTFFGSTVVQLNDFFKPTKMSQEDLPCRDRMIPKPTAYNWFLNG